MNIEQTASVLAKIQLGDNRDVDPLVVREWHDTIGWLEYDDAIAAVQAHRRDSTVYLMPAHVVSGARRIAAERLAEENAALARFTAPAAGAPRPANYDAMSRAWNDPVAWAREVEVYNDQLRAARLPSVDPAVVESRLRVIDATMGRPRSWRGAGY